MQHNHRRVGCGGGTTAEIGWQTLIRARQISWQLSRAPLLKIGELNQTSCLHFFSGEPGRHRNRKEQQQTDQRAVATPVLVVDHQDADRHTAPPAARRGRRIVNSVNSPSRLSTLIVPLCCWVTMSQAIDRPRPVPSPVGLVVKNGWKSLSRNSGGIPVPLSCTRTSTSLPRSRVVTF